MIELNTQDATLAVDEQAGGRVAQCRVGGLDLLVGARAGVTQWGAFPMAPWAGRIRHGQFTFDGRRFGLSTRLMPPHAIHGTVLDRPWAVAEAADDRVVLTCELGDGWPWPGSARQVFTLAAGRADFDLSVHATHEPFPASVGWHPWFRRWLGRGDRVEIGLHAASMLARDDEGIPTGDQVPLPPGPWDDCFTGVRWPVTLTWPGALRLDVTGTTTYAVVFDEPEDAVCVEPQTGPPDALNIEPAVVTPDRPLGATMSWAWTIPPDPRPASSAAASRHSVH